MRLPLSVRLLRLLIVLLAACLSGCEATDATFPSRAITYLVTFDPGGPSDREARRQQPRLERALGQSVIIDYEVGGGGALGWSELVRARPDGYLVAGINVPHIILQPLQQQTGYQTSQIQPLVFFQRTVLALTVLASSPITTLDQFLAAAREAPGELSVGGSGSFSGTHFATLRLERAANVELNYVPFTGAAPAFTAFLGGHVQAAFAQSDEIVRYRDQVRVLAVTGDERFPHFPDVPTFKELGFDVVEFVDRGVGVPLGVPDAALSRLETAFLEVARDSQIVETMEREGYLPLAMDRRESAAHVDRLTQVYSALLEDLPKP